MNWNMKQSAVQGHFLHCISQEKLAIGAHTYTVAVWLLISVIPSNACAFYNFVVVKTIYLLKKVVLKNCTVSMLKKIFYALAHQCPRVSVSLFNCIAYRHVVV